MAFTLAEVLITLGIIGIVAAMTIPTLIANSQKKEYSSRLAQTYSLLSQAMLISQSKYGDISMWGYQKNYGTDVDDDGRKNAIVNFAETYFIPNLKIARNYGFTDQMDIGYESINATKDGREYFNSSRYIVELYNGVILQFVYNASQNTDGSGFVLDDPLIFIDVNGKKGPNVLGIDFYMVYLSSRKNKILMAGAEDGYTRDELKELCSSHSDGPVTDNLKCGLLIQMDGWKFAKDYPW